MGANSVRQVRDTGGAESGPERSGAVPDEAYRIVRVVVIAVAIVSMFCALLVKYLVTGSVVRDGLGWVLLALQVVFVVAMPLVIFRPRSRKTS